MPDNPDDAGQQAGDDGRYETVLQVVRAMCAHDETLAAELAAARTRRAAAAEGDQPPELPARITVHAPPGTLAATLDALRIHVADGTTSSWWDGYGHARAHHGEHGNLDLPYRYVTPGGFRLGAWLSWQRTDRNRDALPDERARLLDELGMTWDPVEAAWMRSYAEAS